MPKQLAFFRSSQISVLLFTHGFDIIVFNSAFCFLQTTETDLLESLHVFALERVKQGLAEYGNNAFDFLYFISCLLLV